MKLPGRSRYFHAGDEARHWASLRFELHLQPLAAWVVELIYDIAGVDWSSIQSDATFTHDLRMDDLEPVELAMAIERELGISIPDEDCASLTTVADLIGYLNQRLSSEMGYA
jgi:acyl carrier protein